MTQKDIRRATRLAPVLAALVIAIGSATPASAADTCAGDLASCYSAASSIDSFWTRTAAGLDCELSFVDCTRVALMAY